MFARPTAPPLDVLERVEAWTRDRFGVAADDLVLVAEEPGRQPGLPPRLTTIRFWDAQGGGRYRIRIFKPAEDVVSADLPERWLREACRDDGEPDCC